jgi:hypothetical protein
MRLGRKASSGEVSPAGGPSLVKELAGASTSQAEGHREGRAAGSERKLIPAVCCFYGQPLLGV